MCRTSGNGQPAARRRLSRNVALLGSASALLLMAAGCGGPDPSQQPSVQSFIEAQQALANGDKAAAMELLTASIEAKPNGWAYLERAKLYLEQGDDASAIADCDAGLAEQPDNADLKWLRDEAQKPAAERFKGRFAKPPSDGK